MGLDYQEIIEANQSQFKYIISEKHKLIKKISTTKYALISIIFFYTAFKIFPGLLEDYSLNKSVVIAVSIVSILGFLIILTKNELFLTSNNIKKLDVRFKNKLVLNLIKSISDKLVFNSVNRISTKILRESGLFKHNFTDVKGNNLIKGKFDNIIIQISDILLFKGGSKKFQGVFYYVKGINGTQIINHELDKLTNLWRHNGDELYIAISKRRMQFHIDLKESNKSLEIVKKDFHDLLRVLQTISKITGIQFEGTFVEQTNETNAFDDIFGKKSVYNNFATRQDFILADSTKRILNFMIDQIIITFLAILVLIIINISNITLFLSILLGVYILYYVLLEYLLSQTVGKILTKSKVINLNGSKPGITSIILRTFCRWIPFEQYSFLDTNIGLHDKLSKTIVVDSRDNKP